MGRVETQSVDEACLLSVGEGGNSGRHTPQTVQLRVEHTEHDAGLVCILEGGNNSSPAICLKQCSILWSEDRHRLHLFRVTEGGMMKTSDCLVSFSYTLVLFFARRRQQDKQ